MESAKTYTGMKRLTYNGPELSDEEMEALRKRASDNLGRIASGVYAREKTKREEAAEAKRKEREERRTYMTGLRTTRRETQDEIKALRRVVRNYERRYDKGELTKKEHGAYDEADARLEKLCEYIADIRELIREGW